METPARDALLKLACNSSLTRDASAPQGLTEPQKKCLEADQALVKLKLAYQALRNDLIAEFHQLNKETSDDAKRFDEYRTLQKLIRARRKKIHDDAKGKM
ncbi:hypothetical protein POX_b02192 [Penicillium oxalicum]|uniref:Uncharacterized protein n=1 Tax=Penicillium oxalicum (strain 114-2 / CGMCC 5302) TaxID=933388 RepID=S8B7V7_PENO1|nr:hypothetical protein POX_b02192 [Penicillium oxalicum]EPS30807.1 hypothetical protein PDE_05759 [Penicillium oxalicum 114-2]KAI2792155.1 hypothetical protein POX_b02192 [Penicillium oxalicum]